MPIGLLPTSGGNIRNMQERNSDKSIFRRVVRLAKDPGTDRIAPERIQSAINLAAELEQALTVDNKGVISPLDQNSTEGKLV